MSDTPQRKSLPANPSLEHLRKQAKRLAKSIPGLPLAAAQHQLAQQYGYRTWAELTQQVAVLNSPRPPTVLQRIIDANRLAKEGMPAEALAIILQCLDEVSKIGLRAAGVQSHFVFAPLVNLANAYPPARQALVDRQAQIRLLTQPPAGELISWPAETAPEIVDASRRHRRAAQMVMRGENSEEALRELLWCFDEGMKNSPELRGVRRSFLLGSIAKLGQSYPPARAALLERQERVRREWRNDPDEWRDFSSIARALKDSVSVIAFYDELKRTGAALPDPRWIFEQLIEVRRYSDACAAYPISLHRQKFDEHLADMAQRPEVPYALQVRYLVHLSTNQLEALAGSGDVASAASVVARMLEIDRSDETLKMLQKHADRCGHPELMDQGNT